MLAFKLVFERFFNSDPEDEELWQELKEKDKSFAKDIFSACVNHQLELNDTIRSLVVGYDFDRLHKIDLALLMVAITEIEYLKTPAAVVINEIIEIAKVYSSEDGPKFLNGVLSTYVKQKGIK